MKVIEADYLLDVGSGEIPWSIFSVRWNERRANLFLVDPMIRRQPRMSKAAGGGSTRPFERDLDLTVLSRKVHASRDRPPHFQHVRAHVRVRAACDLVAIVAS